MDNTSMTFVHNVEYLVAKKGMIKTYFEEVVLGTYRGYLLSTAKKGTLNLDLAVKISKLLDYDLDILCTVDIKKYQEAEKRRQEWRKNL